MKAILQRVSSARVEVDGEIVGAIGRGLLVLLGVGHGDTDKEVEWMSAKMVGLRIFEDDDGKMNRSLADIDGEALIVSQFTLYGDASKGRRPSFVAAAPPDLANQLYMDFVKKVGDQGIKTAEGRFGAMMDVHLVNDGPVTLILER